MTHPTDEELLRLCLEGGPTAELRERAAAPDGGDLAARLRSAEALTAVLAELPLERPPAAVAKSARGLGRARAAA